MSKRVLVVYRDFPEVGPYQAAVNAAGMEPVLAAVGGAVSLNGFAGLLLTGGGDVNPERYGESAHPQTEPPDDQRDALEAALIAESLERDLPLLAICRGLQILNVQHGGTLIQHLDPGFGHQTALEDRSQPAHSVTIQPQTLLADIAGTDTWRVNLRHHQAAARIGTGLRVSARDSGDGTVEALERPDKRFALAVQWHPEDQVFEHAEQLRLFTSFAAAL